MFEVDLFAARGHSFLFKSHTPNLQWSFANYSLTNQMRQWYARLGPIWPIYRA